MSAPKKIFARSVWVMLAIFFALITVFIAVGTSIMSDNSAVINAKLGIDTYKKVQLETAGEEDMEYFKSDYIKYNADGTPMTQTDVDEEGGKYTHQVYDDIAMRAASEAVAEQTAVEGTVLLWNDEIEGGEKALPLAADSGVSIYGVNQNKYVLLGNGSGAMALDPKDGSLYNALRNKDLAVNSKLNTTYLQLLGEKEGDSAKYGRQTWNDGSSANYACHFKAGEVPWDRVAAVTDETIGNYGDAAIMVVSRVAGEDYDISENIGDKAADGSNNHLELTAEEAGVLSALNTLKSAGKVKSIILLMNTANPLQFGELLGEDGKENYGVDACLWVGEGGTMSYVQIADVLTDTGGYALSGRTTDTLLYNNTSAPSYANFGDFTWTEYDDGIPDISAEYGAYYQTHNLKYMVYQEGIYVGYRYYETRYEDYVLGTGNASGNAGATDGSGWDYSEEVAFPFGYGLGYTEFSYSDVTFSESDKAITVSVTVTNTGSTYSGKDVVQVYMQRPYTGRKGVEVPAVELVGFAKTELLAPGADQTVTVTVDKENMRTYDAYGEGTYILEQGEYRFAVGRNAHDALNNIIIDKEPNADRSRMYFFEGDGNGDANNVYTVNVNKTDTKIYSVSEESGKEVKIENRLSDADLNLYEGTKNDQSITYLSRSDWNGTYPETAVELECTNEIMVRDMQYGHEVPVEEGDTMPVYDTVTAPEGELTLAMFIDLEYDNPKWGDLLNQMTFTEQQWLCSYGLLKMAGATSVAAPGAKATDGPGGVKNNNPVAGQQFGFPSPVVMAQTWNTSLIEDLGVAFAHEALHLDIAVIYAPGANIHRSLYSGRNWEYYSEDGVLSGEILAAEVKGIQSKGVMVMTKHFAFNDQERNRYGVATFFNEQSAREIYLRPFEIAVRKSGMNGVMSSFNRIGCTWAGAHKGLLTDILRDEWNFIGMVETDSCTGNTFHMGHKWAKAEGLVAGNDMWMANGSETYFEDSKDNPTVMLALREACHRILYNQLHSLAMNGVSTSTRIVEITPWWKIALTAAAVVMGVITLACVVMAVLSFLFASEKYNAWLRASAAKKAEKAAAEAEARKAAAYSRAGGNAGGASGGADGESGDEPPKKKSWFARHRKLLILIGSIVIAVIVIVAIVVPVTTCGGATQPAPTPTPEPEPTPEVHVCEQVCPICGGCLDSECEDPVCATKCGAGKDAYVFEAEDAEIADGTATYAGYRIVTSGDRTYVGDLNHNTGATVTFTVNAQAAATVSLVVTINRRSAQTVFTDKFGVSVNNGRDLDRPTIVPAYADQWTDASFMDFNLGCIDLEAGENTIRFTVLTTGDVSGYNFDKITLLSDVAVTEPHECTSVCTICGGCLDAECDAPACETKCPGHDVRDFEILGTQSTLGAGSNGYPIQAPDAGAPEGLVGKLSENVGASLTFRFKAATSGRAKLIANVTTRYQELNFTDYMSVEVNGAPYETSAKVPTDGADRWLVPTAVELGEIELTAGEVTEVKFTVITADDLIGFNFYSLKVVRDDIEAEEPEPEPEPEGYEVQLDGVTQARRGSGVKGLPNKSENVVGNLSENVGASLTFEFTAAEAGKANLTAAVTNRSKRVKFSDYLTVTVNGTVYATDAQTPSGSSDNWYDTQEVLLGDIDIVKGINTVKFSVASADSMTGVNFGYIEVTSETEISDHVCNSVCDDCGKCTDADCAELGCTDKCADHVSVTLKGSEATFGNGVKGAPNLEEQRDGLVGNLSENTNATLTFAVNSEAGGSARLIVGVTTRTAAFKFTDSMSVSVNSGEPLVSDAEVPATIPEDGGKVTDNWYDTVEIDLGEITLTAGDNTIVFTRLSPDVLGFNFGYIRVVTNIAQA